MSVWKYKANPDHNQFCCGLDFHEGQTVATVPASLRLMMAQMAEYANLQRILPLAGKTERLTLPYDIPPQEFLCSIPAPAAGVKGNIVFAFYDGKKKETEYPRADYSGHYVIRFPEGVIADIAPADIPAGTICHFWEAVPDGWEDITEQYKGRYIEGCAPADIGKTFAGENKKHKHEGQSGDKREGKWVHFDFQQPANSVYAGNRWVGAGVGVFNRGEHSHELNIHADGADTPKPAHIILRLGRKL